MSLAGDVLFPRRLKRQHLRQHRAQDHDEGQEIMAVVDLFTLLQRDNVTPAHGLEIHMHQHHS
jgi:hypothetical protein